MTARRSPQDAPLRATGNEIEEVERLIASLESEANLLYQRFPVTSGERSVIAAYLRRLLPSRRQP